MNKLFASALLCALTLLTASCAGIAGRGASSQCAVVALKCEYAVDPLGIDSPKPRLFWQLASERRGAAQGAYRILVADSPAALDRDQGNLWDSGRVESNETIQISYGGKPLVSSQRVYWKVRAWDETNAATAWSDAATWTMGLLAPDDWKSAWIGAASPSQSVLLRKEFAVKPGLKRALAHVTGLGQYEMRLNGSKCGNDVLSPGWTNYNKTELYDTRDVTDQVREGKNAVGLILGNSMYKVERPNRFAKFVGSFGELRAILHLRLEYQDGSVEVVGTDETWKTNPGPVTFNSIYGGEDYDARLDPTGWDATGFDDKDWPAAAPAKTSGGVLRGLSAAADPLRVIETRKPVSEKLFDDGSIVYDLGQNTSYMPTISVTGPKGSTVRLVPAEVIHEDGRINRRSTGNVQRGIAWWQYTKATDSEESWTPRFFYVGCRYLRADFLPPGSEKIPPRLDQQDQTVLAPLEAGSPDMRPRIASIEGNIVHSSAAAVGDFEASDPLLNRIRELVRWAQRSNMVSVLTDCPHREKLGWLEQYHLNGPSIRYEFDVARIYTKGMNDMADAQTPEGLIPNIAPEYTEFKGTFRAATEWGAAFFLVPWQQYEFNGDLELMRAHYDAMKKYFAYLESKTEDGLISEGLGDWYDIGPKRSGVSQNTPPPITATAFLYHDATVLAKIATLLGKNDDAAHFNQRAEAIRADCLRHYLNAETGTYATNSQCANALALDMGIIPGEERGRALAALVKDVETNGYATTAGDVGFRYVLRALAEGGRSDVVYKMMTQDQKPGYAYQLAQGATALTENWNASPSSSNNHFMLGQATEWLYGYLAGISCDPSDSSYKKIVIKPNPVGDLKWVRASYDSIHGKIAVRWERKDGGLDLDVTIPPNTTAMICVPAAEGAAITEGGAPVEKVEGLKSSAPEMDYAVFAVGAGSYRFNTSRLPK